MTFKSRAFGYVRVSVDEEGENNASIASQIGAIRKHCEKNQIELLQIFEEPNVSGRKAVRKQFDLMIAAAVAPEKPVQEVVVYALSRFARRLLVQLASEDSLAKAGVTVTSLTEAFSDDASGRMMRGFVGLVNEKYANDAALFTRRDRRQNAARGFFNGGPVPFGYRSATVQTDRKKERKKLFVVDAEAAVVQRIFCLAESGDGKGSMGTRSIAEWLRLHGHTMRGAEFFHGSIDRILNLHHYAGRYPDRTKDDKGKDPSPENWIWVDCPQIIEPEQIARVAALRARRAPRVTPPRIVNGPTLLTGLASCGMPSCRAGMTIATGKGGRYRYYKCGAKQNGATARCACPIIPEKILDDVVLDGLVHRVLQPDRLRALLESVLEKSVDADTRRHNDLNQARKALTKIDTAIGRLLDAIEEGVMSARDPIFAQRIAERRSEKSGLITTIDGLERQLARGAAQITPEAVEKFGALIVEKLKGEDATFRKAYVRLLVEKVEVSGAEIRISGSRGALEAAIMSRALPRGGVPSFDREWCPWPDSNQHGFLHPILSRTRLPFHHRGTQAPVSALPGAFQRLAVAQVYDAGLQQPTTI